MLRPCFCAGNGKTAIMALFVVLIVSTLSRAEGDALPDSKTTVAAEASPAEEFPKVEKTPASLFSSDFQASEADRKAPIFVKSQSLQVDSNKRVFSYRGNVEAIQGEMVITTDSLIGHYSAKNEIERLACEGNVVITRGVDMRASSNRADYDVVRQTIVLTESPEIFDKGNALTADKITIYVSEDRSEAEGNVRVKVIRTGPDDAGGGSKMPTGGA